MVNQIRDKNMATLAHAAELASRVVLKVAGEAVATTVHGKIMSDAEVKHAVVAKMQSCFITSPTKAAGVDQ